MRIDLKILVLVLVIICSISSTWAVEGMCCYVPQSGNTIQQKFDNCGEGEFEVGDFANNPMCDYEDKKQGCKIDGTCYETVFNSYIYDLDGVKNYFSETKGVDLDLYCDDLVEFGPSCSGDVSGGEVEIGTGDEGGGEGSDETEEGDPIDPGDFSAEEDLHRSQKDMKFCADVGSPYGFFVTKKECNELTNDGERYPCLYNPYYAGELKVSSTENEFGILPSETGCMAKTEIRSCYDYKTRENCVNNPVYDDDYYNRSNLKSCRWVETSEFYDGFDVEGGICISDSVDSNKHFDIEKYALRENLLKNPSFEEGANGWDGDFNVEGGHSFDGNRRVVVPSGANLKQNVNYLAKGVGYRTVLYVMQNSDYQSGDRLFLEINEYDDNNILVDGDNVYDFDLGEYNEMDGVFKKVVFEEHVISEYASNIEFKLYADKDVTMDVI